MAKFGTCSGSLKMIQVAKLKLNDLEKVRGKRPGKFTSILAGSQYSSSRVELGIGILTVDEPTVNI